MCSSGPLIKIKAWGNFTSFSWFFSLPPSCKPPHPDLHHGNFPLRTFYFAHSKREAHLRHLAIIFVTSPSPSSPLLSRLLVRGWVSATSSDLPPHTELHLGYTLDCRHRVIKSRLLHLWKTHRYTPAPPLHSCNSSLHYTVITLRLARLSLRAVMMTVCALTLSDFIISLIAN